MATGTPPRRRLIVNADDLGLSDGVNQGIAVAHERGIVTSASLMVRPPAAARGAAYALRRPGLGVGLHVDLGEWVYRDGQWVTVYAVVPTDDGAAVAAEIDRQLSAFRRLVGRDPDHLDSHQHAHRRGPARSVMAKLAVDLRVPLRQVAGGVGYCGAFYGQSERGEPIPAAVTVAALAGLIAATPPGATELACHPGLDDALDSTYRAERPWEVAALCDPAVRAAVEDAGVELCRFADLARGEETVISPPLPSPASIRSRPAPRPGPWRA